MAERLRYCSLPPSELIEPIGVRTMNAAEFGAYASLMIEIWMAGGELQATEEELAVITRAGKEWPKIQRKVMKMFETGPDSIIRNSLISKYVTHATNRHEQAKAAAAERERLRKERKEAEERARKEAEERRLIESETASNDDRKTKNRRSKEKENVKVNVKVKEKVNVKVTLYSSLFEAFWKAWRALGGIVREDKAEAFRRWNECVSDIGSEEEAAAIIGEAVREFDLYFKWREQTRSEGDKNPRDFVPMAATWLHQRKFLAEYPERFYAWSGNKRNTSDRPVNGVDFWWGMDGDNMVQMAIINGKKVQEPFNEQAWKAAR